MGQCASSPSAATSASLASLDVLDSNAPAAAPPSSGVVGHRIMKHDKHQQQQQQNNHNKQSPHTDAWAFEPFSDDKENADVRNTPTEKADAAGAKSTAAVAGAAAVAAATTKTTTKTTTKEGNDINGGGGAKKKGGGPLSPGTLSLLAEGLDGPKRGSQAKAAGAGKKKKTKRKA